MFISSRESCDNIYITLIYPYLSVDDNIREVTKIKTKLQWVVGLLGILPILIILMLFHEGGHILMAKLSDVTLLQTLLYTDHGQFGLKLIFDTYPLAVIIGGILVDLTLTSVFILRHHHYLSCIALGKLWNAFLFDLCIFHTHDWMQIYALNPIAFFSIIGLLSSLTLFLILSWRDV